ncbi:non-ribosomal peptide synthetase [Leuconostoc suionicum]|uniref:non-ribosomal peptide synthetase n=1 Tax=Leuconostoc suionicum TaxID=1511761 RepID=UPI0024ADD271|nr:non-ribosomal peptide synthetase [Leuconostoc suionicum]MDI6682072.1 non-ribosomal peptide synthetase [Leuconostoc suionicum]
MKTKTLSTGTSITNANNLAEMIVSAVKQSPQQTISYVGSDLVQTISYQETFDDAKNILSNLQAAGLKNGDNIVLALEKHSDNIPLLWACVLGGIVPCPITIKVSDTDLWNNTLKHISGLLNNPTFIIDKKNEKWFTIPNRTLYVENLRTDNTNNPAIYQSKIDDLAFLMLSSGSTGAPKAIELTHKNILSSLRGKAAMTGVNASDTVLNWIAYDHVASLTESHLLPLFVGAKQVQILPIEIVSNPLFFIKSVSRYHVTHTFTPNFLFGQIVSIIDSLRPDSDELDDLNLSQVKRIISGGEANVTSTGEHFLSILAKYGLKKSVIWPAFGMTETCAGSIYSKNFENEIGNQEFGSLGKPVPGLEIRIVNNEDVPVENGVKGELQMHGDLMFKKYHENPEATKAAFTDDGWFKTGDLGIIDPENGLLQLVGRSKDSIIVNGVNYFLHDLEAALGNIEEIEPSYVAAFSTRKKGFDTESLVVFYTPSDEFNEAKSLININSMIRNTTILYWGFRPMLILPVPKSVLGKTSLGKIQSSKLRKKYEAGKFDELIADFKKQESKFVPTVELPKNENEEKVVNLFSSITGIPSSDISVTSSFFALGGTSLETLRLLSGLKKTFADSNQLELVHLLKAPTPRDIVELIFGNTNKSYNPVVPLQKSGDGHPIFMIHPGVGEVLVFINFANLFINERPVYALRARGFNAGEPYFKSFDELVNSYVSAIKLTQPNGPYYISGYSYGGPVSLPIAQKLEEQGEIVHLMVVDAPPVIKHPRGKIDRIESALMLSFFLGFIDKEQLDVLGDTLRKSSDINPVKYLFDIAPQSRVKELGQNLTSFEKWNDLAYHLAQLGATYSPSGTVNDIRVFYAQPIWGSQKEYLETMLKQWDNYSNNPVKYIEVPGEHHTIFDREYVNKFYSAFENELSDIDS